MQNPQLQQEVASFTGHDRVPFSPPAPLSLNLSLPALLVESGTYMWGKMLQTRLRTKIVGLAPGLAELYKAVHSGLQTEHGQLL